MGDSFELTLNSRLTDEDWDKITDAEFENSDRITFRTPSGKTVEFAKVSEEFEWCHDCKEYDAERHCCPRWTKVIRNTVEELNSQNRLEKDGTLQVLTNENLDDVKRVLITQMGSLYGGLYYPDSDKRPKGKWKRISGYVTPGGDPVWCCSKCGKGIHVYGIEHGSYGADIADHQWVACPNCGADMRGEEDGNTPMGQRDKNCPLMEVPKGKWVWVSSTFDRTPCEMRFRCSNCHHEIITHGQKPWQKFCPNCKVGMSEDV